jgi:hypothetical protein
LLARLYMTFSKSFSSMPIHTSGQSTVRRVELHADFLAGYFAGIRKRSRESYPAEVFAAMLHSSCFVLTDKASTDGRPRIDSF